MRALAKTLLFLSLLSLLSVTFIGCARTKPVAQKNIPSYIVDSLSFDRELTWAQELQQKVIAGHPVTPEENARYTAIYLYSQSHPDTAMPQPDVTPENYEPSQPLPSVHADSVSQNISQDVTQEELAWSLALEKRGLEGYQPTSQEMQQYQNIGARLNSNRKSNSDIAPAKPKSNVSPVAQTDIDWALALEERFKQGYQPTSEEITRYQEIFKKLQDAQ